MPNFDDKNNLDNNPQSFNQKDTSTDNLSSNENVSLFDLTKKEDERQITQNIPINKTEPLSQKSSVNFQPDSNQKNIIKNDQPEEPLPATRDEAQIGTFSQPHPENPVTLEESKAEPIQQQELPNEKDIPQEKPKKKNLWLIVKFLLFIVGSFLFVYLFLNFPALWSKLNYSLKEKTGLKPQIQTIIPASTDEDLLFLSTVSLYETPAKDEPQKQVKKGPTKEELGLSGISNNELWIPKLDIKAPIVWDSPVDDATMMENLKHGIVHYKGTTKPGEKAQDGEGNIFLSGHSSYYWWDEGKYKTIFANLEKLEVGDEIGVGYDDYGYVYRVFEKNIVNPDQLDVLNQDTDKNILSIMTCYPVGTNNQRLIVKAEFVARAKDEPETIEEEPSVKVAPTPIPTPIVTSSPILAPTQYEKPIPSTNNIDVINLLPWNW